MDKMSRKAAKKEQKAREKERIKVEKDYARKHPTQVEIVQPETREEMRLTRKGHYELGSDGKLTAKGKSKRLTHRYNVIIIVLILLIIATYAAFFLIN